MFKKLRDKLKGALDSLTGKVKEEGVVDEEVPEEVTEETPETEESEIKEPEEPEDEPEQDDVSSQQETDEPEGDEDSEDDDDSHTPEIEDDVEEPETDDYVDEETPEEEPEVDEQPEEEPEFQEPDLPEDLGIDEQEDTPQQELILDDEKPEESPEEEPEMLDDESSQQETDEPEVQAEPAKKKGFFGKMFGKKDESETTEPEPEKQDDGFFTKLSQRITTIQLSEDKFEELFWDLELVLLENNVALSVIEKIKADLKDELTTGRQARGEVSQRIMHRLEQSLREVLSVEQIDLEQSARKNKPLVIVMVGVNGSGKTTTAAKLGAWFARKDYGVVFAAADTFRAAAIQQLEEHAKNLKIPLIKQEYGADPAAVAYDAIEHAKAKGKDVVIIDTAGRLHSNTNLMDELEKVVRVAKPHHIIFVGEAVTGNDCVEQAEKFSEKLPVDGVILTKADVDQSGGAAVSAAYVTGSPILFLGVGQGYDDMKPFSVDEIIASVLPQDL